jgi:hypothetical protein
MKMHEIIHWGLIVILHTQSVTIMLTLVVPFAVVEDGI